VLRETACFPHRRADLVKKLLRTCLGTAKK
jgi:hypothetical protein